MREKFDVKKNVGNYAQNINPNYNIYNRVILSIRLISSLKNQDRLKPIPSRVDYNFFNYCSTCAIKYSKEIFRCKECNQKVRTRPWHRSKLEEWKRV